MSKKNTNGSGGGPTHPVVKNANALPPLPRAKRSRKATPKPCECGCGGTTAGGRFIPGHDSKLKAWALRVERGVMKLADIPHDGMRKAVAAHMKAVGGPTTPSTPAHGIKHEAGTAKPSLVKPKPVVKPPVVNRAAEKIADILKPKPKPHVGMVGAGIKFNESGKPEIDDSDIEDADVDEGE